MSQGSHHKRLKSLLAELPEGRLSDAEVQELHELLAGDRTAQRMYVQHLMTHAMLQTYQGRPPVPPTTPTSSEVPNTNPLPLWPSSSPLISLR